MAHFAKIENDLVVDVVVIPDEQEHRGEEFLNEIGAVGEWIQTSYNSNLRVKFAGVGDIYDRENDRFLPAPPFPSWNWDEEAYSFVPPVQYPSETPEGVEFYRWSEESTSWVAITEEQPNA